jgi:hypothetical protein
VNIEIARRSSIVRIPNTALRFRPSNDIFSALGQTPPTTSAGLDRVEGSGPRRLPDVAAGPARPDLNHSPNPSLPSRQEQSTGVVTGREGEPGKNTGRGDGGQRRFSRRGEGGSGGGSGGGDNAGRGRFAERLQSLTPEEREEFLRRMRERGIDRDTRGGTRPDSTPLLESQHKPPATSSEQSLTARNPRAATIDALFGPLPTVESVGRVWTYVDKQLKPVSVRLGISDGQATELLEGDIRPGTELVTSVSTADASVRPAPGGFGGFPFFGPPRGGFPGGGFGGGGGRQGRGGGRQ